MREQAGPLNVWLAESVTETAVNRAIIAQQTIYPYHSVPDAPGLNELGRHDLEVLSAHYAENPGRLNIRQGDAPPTLYQARAATVIETLAKAGVDIDRVTIADEFPGGDGMSSERVLTILEVGAAPETTTGSSRTSGTQRTGAAG